MKILGGNKSVTFGNTEEISGTICTLYTEYLRYSLGKEVAWKTLAVHYYCGDVGCFSLCQCEKTHSMLLYWTSMLYCIGY